MPSSSEHPTARRAFLKTTTAAVAGALTSVRHSSQAAPSATITQIKTISAQPEFYHGWPTIARRSNGELWLAWSGGRVSHICPFGQVRAMTSKDDGKTWTWPRVLLDGAIDDRDCGFLETAKGTLIATTFSSLAYESYLESGKQFGHYDGKSWTTREMTASMRSQWQACHDRLTDDERKAELGSWLIRSEDGGKTWSQRIATNVNSPHGPTQLADGRLLYAGKQLWTDDKKIGVCESTDDGKTWTWLADIPNREGDTVLKGYHELHAVETDNGTIVAHIRNHNKANAGSTLQTKSTNGGKSWSIPRPITYGLPSHLLKLRDGRLLMSYGHRRAPFGNQARVSSDHGETWSEPMIISGDGMGADLGYPSTVELDDGSLLTVWYETMKEPALAVLRQAHWKLANA